MPFTTIILLSFSHSFIECSVFRPNASLITLCNRFFVVLQVCSHISCLSMCVSFIFYYTGAHTSPSPNFAQDQNLRLTVQSIYLLLTRLGRQGKERGRAAIDCPCRRRSLMRTCFNPRLFVSPLFSKWTWPPANSDFSLRALYAKCFQSIFLQFIFSNFTENMETSAPVLRRKRPVSNWYQCAPVSVLAPGHGRSREKAANWEVISITTSGQ